MFSRWAPLAHALLGVTVVFAIWAVGYRWGADKENRECAVKWSQRDTADLKAQVATQAAFNAERDRWLSEKETSEREFSQKLEGVKAAANGSHSESERLRKQLADLQFRLRNAAPNTGAIGSGQTATGAAMVLSDLLGSCSKERSEISGAFDEARLRGLACERSYDSLRRPTSSSK